MGRGFKQLGLPLSLSVSNINNSLFYLTRADLRAREGGEEKITFFPPSIQKNFHFMNY